MKWICQFIYFVLCLLAADARSLQFLCTAFTAETKFPSSLHTETITLGFLNEKRFMSYNSTNGTIIPKDWIQKQKSDKYWKSKTEDMLGDQEKINMKLKEIKTYFNHSTGVHTLQRMYGCECDDNNITKLYDRYGYDGEDFISLDLMTGTWTADNNKAVKFITAWDPKGENAKYWKDYLENECNNYLGINCSKDPPTASVFHKHSPSPEVVCHATGFFPKAVIITWRKDGEDVLEDVDLRETLPNQDRSFQKRSVLKVPAEELQKHKYTCVIQHSSLKEEMVLDVAQDGGPIALIIGVIAGLVVLIAVITAVVLFWKKKKKKKKTESKRLQTQNSACYSVVDSSSNNSTETSNSVTLCCTERERGEDGDEDTP